MKELLREIVPPLLWRGLRSLKTRSARPSDQQDLDVYWDPHMAEMLEHWGEGNAWNEIQLLLVGRKGKVLDIACGTGKTMSLFEEFPDLEVHGCDISDMLLERAIARGISPDRLVVTDATQMKYAEDAFEWGYSIGSLEHFTEDGILRLLRECHRVVRHATFHMVPIARSGSDEGWIKTVQSYHNNSVEWWMEKCRSVYPCVQALDSSWSDSISTGKWFVCTKE